VSDKQPWSVRLADRDKERNGTKVAWPEIVPENESHGRIGGWSFESIHGHCRYLKRTDDPWEITPPTSACWAWSWFSWSPLPPSSYPVSNLS